MLFVVELGHDIVNSMLVTTTNRIATTCVVGGGIGGGEAGGGGGGRAGGGGWWHAPYAGQSTAPLLASKTTLACSAGGDVEPQLSQSRRAVSTALLGLAVST